MKKVKATVIAVMLMSAACTNNPNDQRGTSSPGETVKTTADSTLNKNATNNANIDTGATHNNYNNSSNGPNTGGNGTAGNTNASQGSVNGTTPAGGQVTGSQHNASRTDTAYKK